MPRTSAMTGARIMPTTAIIEMPPAITMVNRSPMRATAHPAGRLPQSWPTTRAAATRAAAATSAPMFAAITGIRGMTAPSPSAKRTVGRYTIGPNCFRTDDALLTEPTVLRA